jgi:hypothetical protein
MIEATDWRAVDCDAGLRKTEQHISIEALAEQSDWQQQKKSPRCRG